MRMKAKSAHKQRIYKENSNPRPKQPKLNLSLFPSFCEANSNSEPTLSRKKSREQGRKIKSENLKMKKITKISWKEKGCFRWDKRSGFNGT